MTNDPQDGGLRTLSKDGRRPVTRLESATEARAMVQNFIQAEEPYRAKKRAAVQGCVDGNPPYDVTKQRRAGRGKNCNVNWGIARSYLDAALSAFYDIFAEASTYATVKTKLTKAGIDQQAEYSGIITEAFHRLQSDEKSFDYNMQLSQYDMVLFGCGPMIFCDTMDWRCPSVRCKNVLVPEHAKSDSALWECAVIRQTLLPHELYAFIRNRESASALGWNYEATSQAIMDAHPMTQNGGMWLNWEWHQQNLKNGSYYWSNQQKVIQVAHVFIKEFPTDDESEGKISHKIILESDSVANSGFKNLADKFLFEKIGRFDNWHQCIHPMYYDHGGGGEHHSVTGMGVKMYAAMEYQNRLLCNLADKAFAPKLMFKPTTASNKQKMSIAHYGDYGVMPDGYDMQQIPVGGFLQDGIAYNRELSGIVASNLSQYRQNLQREQGNPITASESNWRASEQSRLGKTQLNRYYDQLDFLYAEKYRRASNPKLTKSMPGGTEALEFQRYCLDRGVPQEALTDVECVRATRVAGYGSLFLRQQSLEFLLGMIATLPETGRDHLIRDVIASRTDQSSAERYYPMSVQSKRPTDQNAMAMLQVAAMKEGIPAVVTSTQNPVIFAQTFLQAGAQALQSVTQGADPSQVAMFLELIGQATAAHLQRIAQDPTRKDAYQILLKQSQQLAKNTDELRKYIERQQEAQQQQQQEMQAAKQQAAMIGSGQDPKAAVDIALAQHKMQLDDAKTKHGLFLKREKAEQQMEIADKVNAAKIIRDNAKLAESTAK